MARILMLSIPAHGHINPTLALVKGLVQKGQPMNSVLLFLAVFVAVGRWNLFF
jgi:hypothetical protein